MPRTTVGVQQFVDTSLCVWVRWYHAQLRKTGKVCSGDSWLRKVGCGGTAGAFLRKLSSSVNSEIDETGGGPYAEMLALQLLAEFAASPGDGHSSSQVFEKHDLSSKPRRSGDHTAWLGAFPLVAWQRCVLFARA